MRTHAHPVSALAVALLTASLLAVARAQPPGIEGPIGEELAAYARDAVATFHLQNAFAITPQPVPNWPTLYAGGDWWFQYPPDWFVQRAEPHGAHVSDARGLAQLAFVEVERAAGCPSLEELADRLIRTRLASDYRVVAWDQGRVAGTEWTGSETGLSLFWVFRYPHPAAGTMVGTLSVQLIGRGALCLDTLYAWTFTGCPETELAWTAQRALGPMALSFVWIHASGSTDRDPPEPPEPPGDDGGGDGD